MGVYYVRVNGEGVQKHSRGVCTGVIRGYTVQSGAPRGIVNTYFSWFHKFHGQYQNVQTEQGTHYPFTLHHFS